MVGRSGDGLAEHPVGVARRVPVRLGRLLCAPTTPAPLFVISALAEHTRNLGGDPRASLLVTEPDVAARSAGPRPGHARRRRRAGRPTPSSRRRSPLVVEPRPGRRRVRRVRRLPCFRLAVRAIRWVGGFGEMDWVDADAYASGRRRPGAPPPPRHRRPHERRPRRCRVAAVPAGPRRAPPATSARRCATSTATAASTSPRPRR